MAVAGILGELRHALLRAQVKVQWATQEEDANSSISCIIATIVRNLDPIITPASWTLLSPANLSGTIYHFSPCTTRSHVQPNGFSGLADYVARSSLLATQLEPRQPNDVHDFRHTACLIGDPRTLASR
ncbi:hypothetical protein EG328_001674 [Venturia inaequalis]|uniref:Uncharacterized protein n=1 Tax=Venturia inaequalis TaxID=5025 RepID=A0A8H3UVT4_VENIN|nr:hypothetical protein EG328_001674 [Venturia inaequalis]RDI85853.1 hypothetical protein Vi05172_g4030 [Venturia inaequalis]